MPFSSFFCRFPRRDTRRAQLSLELLEDRTVPSTFTVLNLKDAGTGSLRQAIRDANAAPGADAIAFAPAVRGTLTLTSGELSVTDALNITGPGAGRLNVSGNHASRIFNITDSQVAISGLTVADGLTTGRQALGGGILNTGGRLTLTGVAFVANEARGDGDNGADAGGGAVANVFGATLTITNCTFTGNRSSALDISYGGGILNDAGSDLVVTASNFTGNRSSGNLGFGDAGAVAVLGDSTARLTDCTFTDNQARGGDGEAGKDGRPADGGAVVADESLLVPNVNKAALVIGHCLFAGNEAQGGHGGAAGNGSAVGNGNYGVGGAIALFAGSTATVTNSEFHGNRAIGGNGGQGSSKVAGGNGGTGAAAAITNVNSRLSVERSSFLENLAQGGTGGNSPIAGGNGGRSRGGAIHTPYFNYFPGFHTITTLIDVTVRGNRVTGGSGGDGGPGRGGNGGLAQGGGFSQNGGTMAVYGTTVDGNRATGGTGGTGAIRGNGGIAHGGGIGSYSEDWRGTLTMFGCLVEYNQAIGGYGLLGGQSLGGGIFVGGVGNGRTATATISDTTVVGNQAIGGEGTSRGGDGLGGGVYNGNHAETTLHGCTVTTNRATGGTGPTASQGVGGGVYITSAGTAYADLVTLIFANDASTNDDDVFGNLILL